MFSHYSQVKVGKGEISKEEMTRVLSLLLYLVTQYGRNKAQFGASMDAIVLNFVKTYHIFPGMEFFDRTNEAVRISKSKLTWLPQLPLP